jgi:hypothetical protein
VRLYGGIWFASCVHYCRLLLNERKRYLCGGMQWASNAIVYSMSSGRQLIHCNNGSLLGRKLYRDIFISQLQLLSTKLVRGPGLKMFLIDVNTKTFRHAKYLLTEVIE